MHVLNSKYYCSDVCDFTRTATRHTWHFIHVKYCSELYTYKIDHRAVMPEK